MKEKIIKIIKAILRVYLKLLKSDSIIKHFFASSIIVFIIFYFAFISVKIYTKHNRYIEVPILSGLNIEDANKILKKKKLKFEVLDSSKYFSETPVNAILSQIPDAGEFVKKNRKIYLNVNPSDYQKVSIPNIIQITKRNAESILNALGFEVSGFQYVDNIGKNMVLEVLYNGEKMNIGDAIARGAKLELILGNGKNKIDENEIDQQLHEHFSFDVDKGQEPLRIDKFLMNRIENATRNKIQNAAKDGYIRVNENPVKSSYKVKKGDKIKILFTHPPYENLLTPENIDLDIVFEDDTIIIINKPPGLVVHPGHGNYSGTLINGLLYHFKNLPKNSSDRPGLVHRIDKDTSGLIVIAKTEKAMTFLAKQFFNKTVEREYYALVWGDVKNDSGEINEPIGRNPKNRLQMIVYKDIDGGKEAITTYKVIKRFGYVTLISCRLKTGRTHQIRVHMKYLGHVLFSDGRYGGDKILKGTVFSKYKQFIENCFEILPRQALHAKTIGFIHPETKESISFDSKIPNDISQVIDKWELYSKHKKL